MPRSISHRQAQSLPRPRLGESAGGTRQGHYVTTSALGIPRPRGVVQHLRKLARHGALSILGAAFHSDQRNFVRPLYCHYVFDDQVEQFASVLGSLQRLGEFIDTDTCAAMSGGSMKIDGRYFHLSFDDGFRNIVQNAVPILEALKVPAIFFVPTAVVGADWETARRFCLDTTGYGGVMEMVTWDDLKLMAGRGFEVGSHTRTHARLAAVNDAALEDEIAGSRRDIEEHLGVQCKYISWPFGTHRDVSARALEVVAGAGYSACFGAFRGSIYPGQTPGLFAIPRHHFEVQWPRSHIRFFATGHMEG